MKPMDLQPGDVVQIKPDHPGFFGACFMTVTEPKEWGAQGYVQAIRGTRGHQPGGQCYCRVSFADMEYVGRAPWVVARQEGEDA